MDKYREYVGWGSIAHAALSFLPIPIPVLPPSQWVALTQMIPGIGYVALMLMPMLLFAAGIGLVKGWDGGKKLFGIWALIASLSAAAGLQGDPGAAGLDLAIIGGASAIVFWGIWKRR